jgi:hypothetical protein
MSFTIFAPMDVIKELTRKEFFTLVPACQFFNKYCPEVRNYTHKMRGIDGNGKPIDFSESDKAIMKDAAQRLANDLYRMKF